MALTKNEAADALNTLWELTDYGVSFETFFKAVSICGTFDFDDEPITKTVMG